LEGKFVHGIGLLVRYALVWKSVTVRVGRKIPLLDPVLLLTMATVEGQ